MNRNKKNTKEPSASPYLLSRSNSITVSDLADKIMADDGDFEGSQRPESVTPGSVSINLLKELMSRVTANINGQMERMLGGIREDVSQIKEQLEKYNQNQEEVEERISNVEDKVEAFQEVGKNLDAFKEEFKQAISEINIEACPARKNNIIFHGIPGKTKDPKVAMDTFKSVCADKLKMSSEWIREVDITEVYRFPPKGGTDKDDWCLFVSLAKTRHREDLYRNAFHLKDTGISMRNDLAPCLLRVRKILSNEADKLKAAPYNYRTRLRDSAFDVWLL